MKRFKSLIIAGCAALMCAANTFELINPDFEQSPYTGMTRQHWVDAANYLLEGAFGYIQDLDDPMYFPKQLDKTYPRDEGGVPVAKLEGLARTFFLAAPLLRENPDLESNGVKVADYYRHQIRNMVKEGSTSFVPLRTGGPSQTMLELGSLCLSLKICQPVVWDTFTQEEKDALATLFLSYGEGPTISSNWQFFNAFIMSFCKDQGYKVNDEYLQKCLSNLLDLYRGYGWYNDVPAYDYYSMWAFQTYGPLLAVLYGQEQYPDLAERFLLNQQEMVDNYPYMFARDGRMNMWGRSLPYRFASTAPLAVVDWKTINKDSDAFASIPQKEVNYGWLRHISSATLLQFMQHPDFMSDGVPTMGFYGPFAPCVQIYSCRGSVYWLAKAFFNLLLPEDSPYWTAVENVGPWSEMDSQQVYNLFQPGSNLLITNYPDCGGSEMRSWCHEKVSSDWQKFRSSENYNKLAYHTEFPWMADGPDGEVSMNYAVLNSKGEWEVLRLYDFVGFEDGIYRRNAELEVDPEVKFALAEKPVYNGVERTDTITLPYSAKVRLGSYSLPHLGKGFHTSRSIVDGKEQVKISNGEYELTVVANQGWSNVLIVQPHGLHPMSDVCAVIITEADLPAGSHPLSTTHSWRKLP